MINQKSSIGGEKSGTELSNTPNVTHNACDNSDTAQTSHAMMTSQESSNLTDGASEKSDTGARNDSKCIGSESALISKGTKAAVDKPRRLALRKMKEQASKTI